MNRQGPRWMKVNANKLITEMCVQYTVQVGVYRLQSDKMYKDGDKESERKSRQIADGQWIKCAWEQA